MFRFAHFYFIRLSAPAFPIYIVGVIKNIAKRREYFPRALLHRRDFFSVTRRICTLSCLLLFRIELIHGETRVKIVAKMRIGKREKQADPRSTCARPRYSKPPIRNFVWHPANCKRDTPENLSNDEICMMCHCYHHWIFFKQDYYYIYIIKEISYLPTQRDMPDTCARKYQRLQICH